MPVHLLKPMASQLLLLSQVNDPFTQGVVLFLLLLHAGFRLSPQFQAGGQLFNAGLCAGNFGLCCRSCCLEIANGTDPVVWAGAILLVAAVAAAAHVGPARRVVRLDLKRALQVD